MYFDKYDIWIRIGVLIVYNSEIFSDISLVVTMQEFSKELKYYFEHFCTMNLMTFFLLWIRTRKLISAKKKTFFFVFYFFISSLILNPGHPTWSSTSLDTSSSCIWITATLHSIFAGTFHSDFSRLDTYWKFHSPYFMSRFGHTIIITIWDRPSDWDTYWSYYESLGEISETVTWVSSLAEG